MEVVRLELTGASVQGMPAPCATPLESSEMDLNHRPSPYQSDALTNCAIRGEEGCGRADKIRTCDPLIPNQVRYQTALQPAVTAEVSVGVSYVVATGRPWGTRKGQRC